MTHLISGLPAGLSADPSSGAISGTIANSAASGTAYSITALVSDGQTSASQTFTWTVGAVSLTNPGDQDNLDSDTVSVAVTAADAGSSTLTYSLTGQPSGLSINSSTGLISGTLGSSAHTSSPYSVTVTASDGTYSSSAAFSWEVDRLALDNPGDQQALEGTAVSLSQTVTDHAGTPTFSVTGLPSGLSINSSTGAITGTLGSTAHGQSPYVVTITATDGTSTSQQAFVWTVTPQVVLVNPGTQHNAGGDSVSATVTASDRSSGTLAYSESGLPSGLSINSSTGVIAGTVSSGAVSSTPYTVTITASDGTYSSSQTFLWTVSTISLPAPGDQSNLDHDSVSVTMTASYHGSGTLSYSATGLPSGLSINSSGVISGTISDTADADSPYAVTVTATDGTASASQSFNWEVDARVSVDAGGDQSNVPGDVISLTVYADDAATSTPTWTFSASGLLSGLSIDSSTGDITGTLTAATSGTPYAVTVTASDGTMSASQTFNWSVVPVLLADPGDLASVGNAAVSLPLLSDVASGSTVSYSASDLPGGLSINSSTGVISGTLSSGDTGHSYEVTVSATAGGSTSSQVFIWSVGAVVATAPADQTNTEGDSGVSVTVSAAAVSGTLSYFASNLPAGLSINSSTGVITGALDPGTAGVYTVVVGASNGSYADSQSFTWTVNPKITVDAITDQSNLESDTVSLAVTASEPGATLTYSETGLPSGLSINSSTGAITGTVATGDAANGPYTVDVTVTDGTYSTDVEFGWTIMHGSNTAPVLTNPGTQVNVVSDSVNLALSASDADGDSLTYSAVNLPDGLNMDPFAGTIFGTVAEDAVTTTPYAVTVTVDDGNGGTTTQTFDWIINDAALAVTGATVTATEGTEADTVTVATFTDTDVDWQSSDFTATIAWGDGTSSAATIDGSNGSFTVSGDHTYDHPGTFTTQVSVSDGFETLAATSSATVSSAALTVTGSVVQGAVAGTAVSGTWATFTDANPDDPSSSYTATIDWGDGSSTSTGTVAGFDDQYVVSGSHTYSAVGNYTVTVSVTDGDGTSASDTSTARVGDVFAGVKSTLTLASFTSSDPNATTSDYTVTVNWGDGSALDYGATVTESSGVFTVQDSHTYAVDSYDETGGVYSVTVTISTAYSNTLTSTQSIHVARPPMSAVAENIVSQAGVALSNVELATFTEPDLSDSTGEFGATINWGDGTTTTSGTITASGGVFHVLGSHTYAAVGDYPIEIAISQGWGDKLTVKDRFVGNDMAKWGNVDFGWPLVVPGNSKYDYQLTFSQPMGITYAQQYEWESSDDKTAHFVNSYWIYSDATHTQASGIGAVFEFQNKAEAVKITVSRPGLGGKGTIGISLPVYIVQVKVGTPTAERPAGDDLSKFIANQAFNNGNPVVGADVRRTYQIDDEEPQTGPMKSIISTDPNANPLVQAIEYRAAVTLLGPTVGTTANFGVDKIHVGFIQHVTVKQFNATYATTPATKTLYSVMEGKTYLDSPGPAFKPYATEVPKSISTFTTATSAENSKDIVGADSPAILFPLEYMTKAIASISLELNFALDVAASTTEGTNVTYNQDRYFAEAKAPWSFKWLTSSNVKKITPPTSWNTAAPNTIKEEDISGPLANDKLLEHKFRKTKPE